MEEIYTGTFDLQTKCCPYTGYHLFGENNKRGAFMVKLKEQYREHGFSTEKELPDHVCVILRFIATSRDDDLNRVLIDECLAPVLMKMKQGFTEDRNPYGEIIHSLLLIFQEMQKEI
jgi:nitrate reductase delta subunit